MYAKRCNYPNSCHHEPAWQSTKQIQTSVELDILIGEARVVARRLNTPSISRFGPMCSRFVRNGEPRDRGRSICRRRLECHRLLMESSTRAIIPVETTTLCWSEKSGKQTMDTHSATSGKASKMSSSLIHIEHGATHPPLRASSSVCAVVKGTGMM